VKEYGELEAGPRATFRAAHPEMLQYWNWLDTQPQDVIGLNRQYGKLDKADKKAFREQNPELVAFWEARRAAFPNYDDIARLQGQYSNLPGSPKGQMKAEHPEIDQYYAWRDQFAQRHPEWAKYYTKAGQQSQKAAAAQQTAAQGAPVRATAETGTQQAGRTAQRAPYQRRTYYRGRGRGYAGGGGGGGGAQEDVIRRWDEFARVADMGVKQALYNNWGRGTELDEGTLAQLAELHGTYGWGTLEQWLDFLFGLYLNTFPSVEQRAAATPRVQRPHWVPKVWGQIAR
jgi:hypothetical protein